jgi:hypothetical protein
MCDVCKRNNLNNTSNTSNMSSVEQELSVLYDKELVKIPYQRLS